MTRCTPRPRRRPDDRPASRRSRGRAGPLPVACALVALALLAPGAPAQCFEEKLWEQDGGWEQEFGRAVFLADGTVVVGEPEGEGAGMVWTYAKVGPAWTALTCFSAPDAMPGARFGASLWLEGDTLVVGAPHDGEHGPEAGAVYVFEREHGAPGDPSDDRWTHTAKLYPAAASAPLHFGHAVSLRDDRLVVGAPGALYPAPKDEPGGAAVFVRDDAGTPGEPLDDVWIEQAWMDPASPLPSDSGVAVLMLPGAHTALVGEPVAGASAQGSVRILRRDDQGTVDPLDDTWADVDQLTGRDVGGSFGASLAFGTTTLLVGGGYSLPEPELPTEFVGVYMLDDGGTPGDPWDDAFLPQPTLGDPPGSAFGGYGDALAVSDGPGVPRALVSAGSWIWGPPYEGGRVRVYERQVGEWVEQAPLQAPDEFVQDGFGCSLALQDELAVFGARGAPYNDYIEEPPVEGSAWIADLATPDPWSAEGVSDAFLRFAGWGRLEAGATVSLRHYGTWAAGYDVFLVAGTETLWMPVKGTTLVPLPTLVVPLVNGDNGDVLVWGDWPRSGIPSGTQFWFQVFMPPLWGPQNWEASPALVATQP